MRQHGADTVEEDAAASQRAQDPEEGADAAQSRAEPLQDASQGCARDILQGETAMLDLTAIRN